MSILKGVLIFCAGFSVGILATLTFLYFITDQSLHIEKLYYSLPGAIVGLASLIWNISNQAKISALSRSNEQKAYALESFDNYVAAPVRQAIEVIDELMSEIEKAIHDNASGDDDLRAKINRIIDTKVMLSVTKAYRLCAEADQYMKQGGFASQFERDMYFISEDEKLDELIIIKLNEAQQDNQPKVVLNFKMREIEKTVTNKKAYIRTKLTKSSKDIAQSYC